MNKTKSYLSLAVGGTLLTLLLSSCEMPEILKPAPTPTATATITLTVTNTPEPTVTAIPNERTQIFEANYDYSDEYDSSFYLDLTDFDYKLKGANLRTVYTNKSNNDFFSTKELEDDSYFLFIELEATNQGEEEAYDTASYRLDCGDYLGIKEEYELTSAYKNNHNIRTNKIAPEKTGIIAKAFIVPTSCQKLGDLALNIDRHDKGAGQLIIPFEKEYLLQAEEENTSSSPDTDLPEATATIEEQA